jgi:hypothetical protein
MKLAIVGSRTFTDYKRFAEAVTEYIGNEKCELIISGGARGADTFAERYARSRDIPFHAYLPDWRTHGPRAGPLRNTLIVEACTHLLAFPLGDSYGTHDSIRKARAARKPTHVIA